MDPPEHTWLRTLMAKAFTVHQVEKLRPAVRELTHRLLDDLEAQGPPADLVEHYALPIPVAVICRMLGVPEEDRPKLRARNDAALSTSFLTAQEFRHSREEPRAYMSLLIEDHQRRPRPGLMTGLIEARDTGDRLSEQELVDLCVGILVAGHETTATRIPHFVYALLDHPDQLRLLRERPERRSAQRSRNCRGSSPSAAAPLSPVTRRRTWRSEALSYGPVRPCSSQSAPPTPPRRSWSGREATHRVAPLRGPVRVSCPCGSGPPCVLQRSYGPRPSSGTPSGRGRAWCPGPGTARCRWPWDRRADASPL